MPMPVPENGERQQDFIARAHKLLASEFPDTDQRNGIIFSAWRQHHGETEEEKKAHSLLSSRGEFEVKKDVPVFKEHSYVRTLRNRDGSPLLDLDGNAKTVVESYTKEALSKMVENCNRRVLETGDLSPIIDMHTGKKGDGGKPINPELFGFGGPFRLGMLGNEDRKEWGLDTTEFDKGKWAIFQDEWWFKDKAGKAREMPRRSAEVYVGRPMEDRFIDPVAALGGETPALDMGIHYSRNASSGDLVERYSGPLVKVKYDAACMAGPTNVAIPQPVKKEKYSTPNKENSMPADPDTVNACVAAIFETEPFQRMLKFLEEKAAPEPVIPNKEMLTEEGVGEDVMTDEHPGEESKGDEGIADEKETPPKLEESPKSEEREKEMPEVKKPEVEEKENYAFREFQREQKAMYSRLESTILSQRKEIDELKGITKQNVTEKTNANRKSKILDLKYKHGYLFDESDMIQRCSLETMPTESEFQNTLDIVQKYGQQAPIGARIYVDPHLDVSPAAREQVGQYGGMAENEVEQIVQYQANQLREGVQLTYAQARDAVVKGKTKAS